MKHIHINHHYFFLYVSIFYKVKVLIIRRITL